MTTTADQVATAEPIGLNPFEPGFAENPYPQYRRLREAEPVHRTPFGPFMLTRWADVHQLLRDPSTSVEERNAVGRLRVGSRVIEADPEREARWPKAILNIDPPDHTRLRRLVSKAFTPRTVEQLRPRVQQMVDELLDEPGVDRRHGRPDRRPGVPAAVRGDHRAARHARRATGRSCATGRTR